MIEIYSKTIEFSKSSSTGVFMVDDFKTYLDRIDYERANIIKTYDDLSSALEDFEKLRNDCEIKPAKYMRGYYDITITVYFMSIEGFIPVQHCEEGGFTDYQEYMAQFTHNVFNCKE